MRIDFLFEDGRARAAAEALAERAEVRLAVPPTRIEANTVVLPIPLTRDGENTVPPLEMPLKDLGDLLRMLPPHTQLVGYGPRHDALFGLRYIDLEAIPTYVEENAVLTAEGGMALLLDALRDMGLSLQDTACVILGYGRIARHMAARLRAFGCNVLIGARKVGARLAAEAMGYHAFDISEPGFFKHRGRLLFASKPHILINTVPAAAAITAVASMPLPLVGLELSGKTPVLNAMMATLLCPTLDGKALPVRHAPVAAGRALARALLMLDLPHTHSNEVTL